MKSGEKGAVAVIAIAAILLIAYFGGFFTQYGYPPPTLQQTGRQISDQDKSDYAQGIGRWNVFETVVDSLDIATVRTSATNYKIYWYARTGTIWRYLETGNNKYVNLQPSDGGYLWVVVTIPSAQAFYVDYQKIMEGNQYVESYLYTDVDGDGVKEFAFKYNMKGHEIPNSGYPGISFMGFILTYDASFTGLNNLGNVTGIGGTTTTKFNSYFLAFSAAKKGVAIYKVEVKFGTTDETKMRLRKLNIAGIGYLDGNSFTKSYTGVDIRYTYTVSNSFDGALYLKHPSNALNQYDMTLGIEYTLSGGDDIEVTLTVFYLVAQTEAGASAFDSFNAQHT